jgi:DNA-directed RNA polymerase specialized sigma24 family protein
MATTAAAEAAGANKSRPGLDPPPQTAVAPDAPDAREAAPEEEYVPEPADGEEEYVPEDVPEAGAAPDLEQLLAAGARDPEVLSQALAALPADQRETFEAQLKAAGVM